MAAACDPAPPLPPADPACTPEADIEDAENVDDQIIVQGGRNGYLYTYTDDSGTTLEQAGDSYTPGWGGAQGSRAALHISGQLGQGALLARRLVEHGVRFVEVVSGGCSEL